MLAVLVWKLGSTQSRDLALALWKQVWWLLSLSLLTTKSSSAKAPTTKSTAVSLALEHFFKHTKCIETSVCPTATATKIHVELLASTSAKATATKATSTAPKASKASLGWILTLFKGIQSILSVFVVYISLLLVSQDSVRLADFDKDLFGLFLFIIADLVWVIFQCQLSIRALDLLFLGLLVETKDLIVVVTFKLIGAIGFPMFSCRRCGVDVRQEQDDSNKEEWKH